MSRCFVTPIKKSSGTPEGGEIGAPATVVAARVLEKVAAEALAGLTREEAAIRVARAIAALLGESSVEGGLKQNPTGQSTDAGLKK